MASSIVQKIQNSKFKAMVAILCLSLLVFSGGRARAADPVERLVTIYATSYEYQPAVIRVNHGDRVTLRLVSKDVVHGIYIDGYDLNLVADPGKTESLTFVADRAGSFRLRCSVTCGALHPFMIGKLEVGGSSLLWPAAGLALLASGAVLLWKGKE